MLNLFQHPVSSNRAGEDLDLNQVQGDVGALRQG
jgi:hypothetical protein